MVTADSPTAGSPLGISDLLRRASDPSHPAVLDGPTRLTTGQLDARVTAAALALIAAGGEPGDRVILALPTGVDFVVCYLGALRAGLIAVPVNPAYTPAEMDRVAADADPTLRVTVDSVAELLAGAPDGDDPRLDRSGEQTAVLLYTSGTSGQPKGAMLSARAMLANLDQMAALDPPLLDAADVLLVPLPLTHIFGLNAGLGMALRVGATLVLVDQFHPGATLDLMAQAGVTAVLGVPGQFAAWIRQPNFERGFATVRTGISGASALPPAVWAAYAERGVRLLDGYGLTEAAPVVSLEVRPSAVPGSVGRPLPGVEVQLRDAGGEAIDEEEEEDPGRLYVRGPNLFSGYWPDGRDGPDADGWFGTGDIAQRDADGNLHLVGRTSDLVVVHGFNVYPAEVESVLSRQPGVAQVAVVGVADERAGEAIRAFVVPLPGALLDPEALLAAASRSLARFKLPKAIEVVSSLPITVTGKVMKWRLGAAGEEHPDAGQ